MFNPFAEGYVARGKAFTPVKHQRLLARDLANLPQFLCAPRDIVLVPQRPAAAFLNGLRQAGFALPEFVELDGPTIPPASSLCRRKLRSLRPWAWGPDSLELFAPVLANVTGENRAAGQRFNKRIAGLYSKAWSAALLRNILSRWTGELWLCTGQEAGVAVETLDAALEAITAIRRRGHHKIVVKEALGVAGHNSIRLWEPELLETQRRWLANAAQTGRQLVIEPWLERELDFSVQLEMGPDRLKLCGYTGLINDRKGQFQANWAAADHHQLIPSAVTSLLRDPDISRRLAQLYDDIFRQLETELRRADYVGPVGIDAFVYRAPQGDCRLKPIVEINPRYTMGRLTVELMKQTTPGSHGLFRLVSRAMARAEGGEDFVAYAHSLSQRHPLRVEGNATPKIREGALCLNDPAQAQICLAVFQVSPALGALVGGRCL